MGLSGFRRLLTVWLLHLNKCSVLNGLWSAESCLAPANQEDGRHFSSRAVGLAVFAIFAG